MKFQVFIQGAVQKNLADYFAGEYSGTDYGYLARQYLPYHTTFTDWLNKHWDGEETVNVLLVPADGGQSIQPESLRYAVRPMNADGEGEIRWHVELVEDSPSFYSEQHSVKLLNNIEDHLPGYMKAIQHANMMPDMVRDHRALLRLADVLEIRQRAGIVLTKTKMTLLGILYMIYMAKGDVRPALSEINIVSVYRDLVQYRSMAQEGKSHDMGSLFVEKLNEMVEECAFLAPLGALYALLEDASDKNNISRNIKRRCVQDFMRAVHPTDPKLLQGWFEFQNLYFGDNPLTHSAAKIFAYMVLAEQQIEGNLNDISNWVDQMTRTGTLAMVGTPDLIPCELLSEMAIGGKVGELVYPDVVLTTEALPGSFSLSLDTPNEIAQQLPEDTLKDLIDKDVGELYQSAYSQHPLAGQIGNEGLIPRNEMHLKAGGDVISDDAMRAVVLEEGIGLEAEFDSPAWASSIPTMDEVKAHQRTQAALLVGDSHERLVQATKPLTAEEIEASLKNVADKVNALPKEVLPEQKPSDLLGQVFDVVGDSDLMKAVRQIFKTNLKEDKSQQNFNGFVRDVFGKMFDDPYLPLQGKERQFWSKDNDLVVQRLTEALVVISQMTGNEVAISQTLDPLTKQKQTHFSVTRIRARL